jgi:hypothetical protein
MALTAAIRSALIGLLSALVATAATFLADKVGYVISPEDQLRIVLWIVGFAITFGNGLVAWVVNKVGSKYPIVNQILSFGRAKTGAMYVPNNKESVTATATPSGEATSVTVEGPQGGVTPAKV